MTRRSSFKNSWVSPLMAGTATGPARRTPPSLRHAVCPPTVCRRRPPRPHRTPPRPRRLQRRPRRLQRRPRRLQRRPPRLQRRPRRLPPRRQLLRRRPQRLQSRRPPQLPADCGRPHRRITNRSTTGSRSGSDDVVLGAVGESGDVFGPVLAHDQDVMLPVTAGSRLAVWDGDHRLHRYDHSRL